MKTETVLSYFNSETVVDHYESAAQKIGLWKSEEKIFQQIFKLEDSILELGCGVGRSSCSLLAFRFFGLFVFTSHLRSNPKYQAYWAEEQRVWSKGEQKKSLDDFGDRFESTDMGEGYQRATPR